MRIIFLVLFIWGMGGCGSQSSSRLKDGVLVGPGGRTILFKAQRNSVYIKACSNRYPKNLLITKDCEGVKIAQPSRDEFRKSLQLKLKGLPLEYVSDEFKDHVSTYQSGDVNSAPISRDVIENLKILIKRKDREIVAVNDFIASVKMGVKDSDDIKKLDELKSDLITLQRRMAGFLRHNEGISRHEERYNSAVREVNSLIDLLIDGYILNPIIFSKGIFLKNSGSSRNKLFFNLLDSYLTPKRSGFLPYKKGFCMRQCIKDGGVGAISRIIANGCSNWQQCETPNGWVEDGKCQWETLEITCRN